VIINVIVLASLVLAGVYLFLWLLRKDVRDKIEEPKYRFQENVERYDGVVHSSATSDASHVAGKEQGNS